MDPTFALLVTISLFFFFTVCVLKGSVRNSTRRRPESRKAETLWIVFFKFFINLLQLFIQKLASFFCCCFFYSYSHFLCFRLWITSLENQSEFWWVCYLVLLRFLFNIYFFYTVIKCGFILSCTVDNATSNIPSMFYLFQITID